MQKHPKTAILLLFITAYTITEYSEAFAMPKRRERSYVVITNQETQAENSNKLITANKNKSNISNDYSDDSKDDNEINTDYYTDNVETISEN